MVPAGVTLDLGGQTLTVGSAASFGTIMGEGKLAVGEYALAMPANNGSYLPVYEGDGYVFVKVEISQSITTTAEGIKITFWNNNVASDEYLGAIMRDNAAGNGLDVIVRAEWTVNASGDTAVQDFVMNSTLEAQYGAAVFTNPGSFNFTITGADGLADFVVNAGYVIAVGNYVVEVCG